MQLIEVVIDEASIFLSYVVPSFVGFECLK